MTPLRRYTDLRAWLRHLLKGSVHAGTGALLGTVGTNAAENIAPSLLSGLGMDWRQMLGVFCGAAFLEALRRINTATAETVAPFEEEKP